VTEPIDTHLNSRTGSAMTYCSYRLIDYSMALADFLVRSKSFFVDTTCAYTTLNQMLDIVLHTQLHTLHLCSTFLSIHW
jgi:hypothetical protein